MNGKISESRMERSGRDSGVNMVITDRQMLFATGRQDEIIKEVKRMRRP